MLKIGTIELNNPFLQAALSGYTDYPMRILARRFGCALVLTGVMLDRISEQTFVELSPLLTQSRAEKQLVFRDIEGKLFQHMAPDSIIEVFIVDAHRCSPPHIESPCPDCQVMSYDIYTIVSSILRMSICLSPRLHRHLQIHIGG